MDLAWIPYDNSFDPPAPVVTMRLIYDALSGFTADVEVHMLIDMGADVSCVPATAVDYLARRAGPLAYGVGYAAGFDGAVQRVRTYAFGVYGFNRMWKDREFYTMPGNVGVVGRDLLNDLVIELNGPELRWRVTAGEVKP